MITKIQANKLRGMIASYREASLDTATAVRLTAKKHVNVNAHTEIEQEDRLHDNLLAFIREITEK